MTTSTQIMMVQKQSIVQILRVDIWFLIQLVYATPNSTPNSTSKPL